MHAAQLPETVSGLQVIENMETRNKKRVDGRITNLVETNKQTT